MHLGAVRTPAGTVRVDSPAEPTHARSWLTGLEPIGDVRLKSLEKLSRMPVNVPGHGKSGGPELLDEMYEVVRSPMHEVEIAIENRMNREGAIENISFSDWSLVSAGHKHVPERMQKTFVGRIFDQAPPQR